MDIKRFEVPGLAHYSYVLTSGAHAVVVDPRRDIDEYLAYAAASDAGITHIVETHIHADYASGARQLQEATGAELHLSAHDTGERYVYGFAHRDVRDGEEIRAGDMRLRAVHTPGHTPEHLSFLVYDDQRCGEPAALLSGDFLFAASLGRPDLLGEKERHRLAGLLYDSVRHRLAKLPDGLEVLPAHGAGSLCGAGMSQRAQTTLGYERACNPFLRDQSRAAFVEAILGTLPPAPPYYKRMKRVNVEGPRLLRGLPGGDAVPVAELRKAIGGNAVVLDLRRPEAFGGAHIPGSFNIGAGPNLSLWAGWVLSYDRPLYLIADEEADYEGARRALVRVGLDDICGFLAGGMKSWIEAGFEQAHVPQVSVLELAAELDRNPVIVDVRGPEEWENGHIDGAMNIPAGDVEECARELDLAAPVYTICSTGYRASVAASVLKRAGFRHVINVSGGMTAWSRQGLPVTANSATRRTAGA